MAGMNPELAMFSPTPFSISSPFSQNLTPSTSTTNRPGHRANRASSFSFRSRKPKHSPESPSPSLDIALTSPSSGMSDTPPTYTTAMDSTPLSQVTTSLFSQPSVTPPALSKETPTLRHNPSFLLFRHPASETPSVPKAKRNKLIWKRCSEPSFDIVTPSQVQTKEATNAEASQSEGKVQGGVASLTRELDGMTTTAVASQAGVQPDINSNVHADKDPAPNAEHKGKNPSPDTTSSPQTKRWSHAPLLPELNFGATSTDSNPLFNPATHESPPEARINLSILPSAAHSNAPPNSTDPSKLAYRCDVHASDSTSQLTIEHACQELVRSAGGTILDSYFYPGGFLYTLPPGIREPLGTCEIPVPGARITVQNCQCFPEPRFDGLRMHPVGGMLGDDSRSPRKNGLAGKLSKRRKMENLRVQKWAANEEMKAKMAKTEAEKGQHSDREVKSEAENGTGLEKKQPLKSIPENGGISLSSFRSFGKLCRGGSEEANVEPNKPTTPTSTHSNQEYNEKRFAIVAAPSVSDDDSGAEEWESVQSELYE